MATRPRGEQRTVQVVDTSLPAVADAREAVRVSVKGSAGGTDATLTLDVAAVGVGDDAITVTAGGIDGGEDDSVEQAARLGGRFPGQRDQRSGTMAAAAGRGRTGEERKRRE
ncbi:hypothetical protein ABTZ58_17120 [Streptomyces sp. NPDC094143]|uniref:hypothetical protein n=1 Tax=Streptomyces sp. NPDC094143 TaxID=3155310 RepID=UPI003317D054